MLRVNNLPRGTTEENLENFFENTRKFGGGDVTNIDYDEESGSAIITFADKAAVDKVLKKVPILFNKKLIEVERYLGVKKDQQDHGVEDQYQTDNKCTIEVTGTNPNTTEDTLMYYFESKKGVNRDVRRTEFIEEKMLFLVTFEEEEAVQKVLGKIHIVDGYTLKTKRHLYPIKYPNKMLVIGLSDTTPRETLINFLEAKTRLDVEDVEYGVEDTTRAIVTCSDKLDIDQLQEKCNSKPLDGNRLKVQPVIVTNSVIVRGYNDRTSESTLEYYFSNKKKSGVEDVSDVRMNQEEGYCIITFEDPKDVLLACKIQHKVDGRVLQVQIFYECLGLPACNIEQSMKYITIDSIDINKIKFIHYATDFKQEIERKLQNENACITWPDTTKDMIIKIDCTLSDSQRELRTEAKPWEDSVRRHIGSFSDRLTSKHFSVLKDAWDLVTTYLHDENISSVKDFIVTMEGPPVCTITVVGFQKEVEDISNKINALIDRVLADLDIKRQQIQEEVRLKYYQLSILSQLNFQDEFSAVKIVIDMERQSVNFIGSSSDINVAKLSLFEKTKDIVAAPLGERLDGFIEFLQMPEVCMNIKKNIKEANLIGTWEVRNKVLTVYATSDEQAVAVAKIFKDSIIEVKVTIDNLPISLIDSEKWIQHSLLLEDEFKHKTIATKIITDDQKQILVYSTSEGEAASVREKIQDFFLLNMEHEETIPFSPLQLEFMQNQLKDEFGMLETRFKKKNVSITFESEGMNIKGNPVGVDDAEQEIRLLVKLLEKNPEFENLAKQRELVGAQSLSLETKTDKSNYTYEIIGHSIEICKADILSLDADVIVNAAKNDLDHAGGLAKALVKKGGQCIQTECDTHIKENGNLREGETFCSGPGNLKCQLIIHVVGPLYQNGRNREEERLFDCVQRALIETEKRGLLSIVFPALCTGIFGYPMDEATRVIISSVHEYFLDNSKSKIEKVYLCGKDDKVVDCFEKAALDIRKNVHPTKKQNLDRREHRFAVAKQNHVHLGNISIKIIKDRIDRIQADAIVNTTSKDLKLMQGFISSTLAKTAGSTLQRECNMKFPKGIEYGEVAITSGGNLQCTIVCHGALQKWNRDQPVIKNMRKFIMNCLYAANKRNLRSIALPALGTGQLGYPKDVVAQNMYSSVEEFSTNVSKSNITEVFFVLYDQDHETIKISILLNFRLEM